MNEDKRYSPDIVALANKLAAIPLDQTHAEWPTIVPVRLSETERELAVNVLRSHTRSSAATERDPWGQVKNQPRVLATGATRADLELAIQRALMDDDSYGIGADDQDALEAAASFSATFIADAIAGLTGAAQGGLEP